MNQKILTFLGATVFAYALLAPHYSYAASGNLIGNPNFSESSVDPSFTPVDWYHGGWGSNVRVFNYDRSFDPAQNTLRVDIPSYTSGDAKWYFKDVSVIPGHTYTYSDEYSSTITTNASTQIVLRYTMQDGSQTYHWITDLPPSSTGWSSYQTTFTAPSNATSVTVFHLIHSVGTLIIQNPDLEDLSATSTPISSSIQGKPIYADALASGWQNWSWQTNFDPSSTDTVAQGTKALKINYTGVWGGLYLHNDAISTTGYGALSLMLNGGSTGGQQIDMRAYDANGNVLPRIKISDYLPQSGLKANTWQKATVPLSALGIHPGGTFTGFTMQGLTGTTQPPFYLDDIQLTSSSSQNRPSLPPSSYAEIDDLPVSGLADGRLMRFKITAHNTGNVDLAKFIFHLSTPKGVNVSNLKLYAYTSPGYDEPLSGVGAGGQISPTQSLDASNDVSMYPYNPGTTASTTITIPAGMTYYFELQGDIANATPQTIITTSLKDDNLSFSRAI